MQCALNEVCSEQPLTEAQITDLGQTPEGIDQIAESLSNQALAAIICKDPPCFPPKPEDSTQTAPTAQTPQTSQTTPDKKKVDESTTPDETTKKVDEATGPQKAQEQEVKKVDASTLPSSENVDYNAAQKEKPVRFYFTIDN